MIEIDLDDRLAETATEYGIRDITRSVFYGPGLGFDEPPGSDGPPDYDRQYTRTVDSHFRPFSMTSVLKWRSDIIRI